VTHRAGATFGDLCETWLTHASGHLAANTVTETRRILDRTLRPRLGDVALAGLHPEHVGIAAGGTAAPCRRRRSSGSRPTGDHVRQGVSEGHATPSLYRCHGAHRARSQATSLVMEVTRHLNAGCPLPPADGPTFLFARSAPTRAASDRVPIDAPMSCQGAIAVLARRARWRQDRDEPLVEGQALTRPSFLPAARVVAASDRQIVLRTALGRQPIIEPGRRRWSRSDSVAR
jgi:Phage integrase, N-terminal SAM-like domain